MASKNIFDLLPDSDAEEETQQDVKKPSNKAENKKEKPQKSTAQTQQNPKDSKPPVQKEKPSGGDKQTYPKKRPVGQGYNVQYVAKTEEGGKEKKHEKSDREGPKPFKGVPAEPHPMDRKSGTGRGKEVSKSGAGRRNWGTPSDDLNEDKVERVEEREKTKEENLEEIQEEPQKKEVEEYTLEEYYNKRNIKHEAKEEPKKDVKKVDYSQGKLEGLEIVKPKEVVADKGKNPKQQNKDNSHKLALNSENSDLLGFKTGLVLRPPRRDEGAQGQAQPHREPHREPPKEKENKEEEAGEQQTQPTEEGAKRGGRGGRRGGAPRGRDDGFKRENRDAPKKKDVALVMPNLESERDFPTLG